MSVQTRVTGSGKVGWRARWSEAGRDSAMRSRTFDTKRAALLFEADLCRAAQLGAHAPVKPFPDRMGGWLEVWLARGAHDWARTTHAGRRSHLSKWVTPYLADTRLKALGPARILEWREAIRADGCNAKQVNAVMRTLSAALAAAVDAGKLPSNPATGIRRLSTDTVRRDALSAEQAEAIRAALPTQRDRVMWGLLYLAGLRTEEALALRWQDIRGLSRTGGRIAVDRVFVAGEIRQRTKTGAGRDVEIIAALAEDLIRHHEQTAPASGDDLVCPSRVGTHPTWRTGAIAFGGPLWTPWACHGRRLIRDGAPTSR